MLGLLSTSGLFNKETQPWIYKAFVETGEASMDDDMAGVLETVLKRTYRLTKEKGGIFGINVMVSSELVDRSKILIDAAIKVREEDPKIRDHFKVIFTSAGDPIPWGEKIKSAGFQWLHVVPSVKAALRCKKAGVDLVVASGHEGGFHAAWEPLHSMVLLPAVVDALSGSGIIVAGAGGFCDGKTLAAALALGAAGAQMGTRFLATQESDFVPLWKDGVVKAGDRGSLIARGVVGPARWIRTPASVKHQENTIKMSPGVFLGRPDDLATIPPELYQSEVEGIHATYEGDGERGLMAGGECVQRIEDLPTAQEVVDRIMQEATEIVRNFPKHLADS